VFRQDGGVINDGAVFGEVDHIHGDELGAEGHDVQLSAHRFIRLHHLWEWLTLHPPPWELKHRRPVLLRHHR